jgi:hypothetical protein
VEPRRGRAAVKRRSGLIGASLDRTHGRALSPGILRRGGLLALAWTIALALASSGSAANIAPNPGYEADCGGVPCQWTASGFQGSLSTLLYDEQDPHSGEASAKLTVTGRFGSLTSKCVPVTSGSVSFSFWYRTMDADATNLQYIPNYWLDASCSGGVLASDSVQVVPIRDGNWHLSPTETMNVLDGAEAVSLVLTVSCDPCQAGGASAEANFDDVVFSDGGPTSVAVRSLRAARVRGGVAVVWRTAFEAGILGFNVYRQHNGRLVKLNRTLIPSVFGGTASGHRYMWLDQRPSRGRVRYRLEALGVGGSRSWVAAATAPGA